ncbi:MAG TPA: nucleotide exchange factor GrpE [Elusimicrobiota bacterium]|nr:nucleotide exchange factor GrpE [Elusimicrobiota bacterium]
MSRSSESKSKDAALESEQAQAAQDAEALSGKALEAEQPADAAAEPDYFRQLLSLKAEFENYRKRVDREKPEIYKMGRAQILLKLLPIYDLLQKAHGQIQAAHADSDLARGMEGIFKEFEKIFKEEGVAAMDAVGKPYDPLRHEVLGAVESQSPEGTVLDVLQAGFTLHDKVLRPARVRISQGPGKQKQ